MKVKIMLPALTEAQTIFWKPIKHSLLSPLLLALPKYFNRNDEIALQDEHSEILNLSDEPDLVIIQVYNANASHAYSIADHYLSKGAYVCLIGLQVTAAPNQARPHANTIFIGPGDDTFKQFLKDYRRDKAKPVYVSKTVALKSERYAWD
jgi:hypothetical protein